MAQSDPEYAVINYWKVPVYLLHASGGLAEIF